VQFIRPRQVLKMIGVSRTTLWRMVQAGTFPPSIRITERNRAYVLEAVEAWMKARTDGALFHGEVAAADGRRGKGRTAAQAALSGLQRSG
jgi:predicted DNA-binding transcriptional regulator AlpA